MKISRKALTSLLTKLTLPRLIYLPTKAIVFIALPLISIPCICFTTSLAIASPSQAQSMAEAKTTAANSEVNSQNNSQIILYVNPQTGSDRADADKADKKEQHGTIAAPFKTITHALSQVKVGQPVIIQLANGTYRQENGEKFPLRLRQNVTLRGDERNKGRDVVILGGGVMRTGTVLPQNVAIAFADSSELRGVTVTNPNPRGYGLWIENTNPAIANNTLIDNRQDGGLVTGKSRAIISNNQFFRNGTSGLAIEGTASPDVRGNLFQQTIYGMSIRQEATPSISENTFTQNQNGLLIQGIAKPVLRGNAFVNNRDSGLTISDQAAPDLGKSNDEGSNTFQGNGRLDLQNVSTNAIALVGNSLDPKKVKGNLQLSNVRPPVNLFANNASQPVNQIGEKPNSANSRTSGLIANFERSFNSNSGNSNIPASGDRQNNADSAFWYEPVNSTIIRITPKRADSPFPNNAEITASLPPVRALPPSGEPVNQPIQIAPLSNPNLTPQTPPRYRVVVPVDSPNEVALVRQAVPSSFASRLNGYLVVQIGAYSDRRIAEAQVSRLAQQGFTAKIESIKR
jgi:nitrous oxidase accessory protein NosD